MRNLPLYSAGQKAGHVRRRESVYTTFFWILWGSPGATPETPRTRPGPPQKHPDSALRPPEHTYRLSARALRVASCAPPPLRAPPARPPARVSFSPPLCVPCAPGPIGGGRLKRTPTHSSTTTHRWHFSLLHRRAHLLWSPCVHGCLLVRGSLAGRGVQVTERVWAVGQVPGRARPLPVCAGCRACTGTRVCA